MWYQIPPYNTSANVDLLVVLTMAVLSVALILVPFIPGPARHPSLDPRPPADLAPLLRRTARGARLSGAQGVAESRATQASTSSGSLGSACERLR